MREIKFRGKRINDGDWAYGYLFHSKHGTAILVNCYEYLEKSEVGYGSSWHFPSELYTPYEVDPSTVGQYTGLKDKNETDIYEDDILRVKGTNGFTFDYNRVVKFENGVFGIQGQDLRNHENISIAIKSLIEVIGNIHDNPERVKV